MQASINETPTADDGARALWRIVEADALDAMRTLPPASVDAVVADPPYCSGGWTESGRTRSPNQGVRSASAPWFDGDNMTTTGLLALLRSIGVQSLRVLKPGGSLLLFCDWRMAASVSPAVESAGLRHRALVVWDKCSAGLGYGFRPQHELVLCFTRRTAKFHDLAASNVLRFPRVRAARKHHPCEKPVDLMRALVGVVSHPGGVVLDPFCGSGTAGVAAVLSGRRFVGVDFDPGACAVAARRLVAAAESLETPAACG